MCLNGTQELSPTIMKGVPDNITLNSPCISIPEIKPGSLCIELATVYEFSSLDIHISSSDSLCNCIHKLCDQHSATPSWWVVEAISYYFNISCQMTDCCPHIQGANSSLLDCNIRVSVMRINESRVKGDSGARNSGYCKYFSLFP